MKSKFDMDEKAVLDKLNEAFRIRAIELQFIPLGDSAYSYLLHCDGGDRYYVKLFDLNNDHQRRGAQKLDYYLPLTSRLYHSGAFQQLTWPIRTASGDFTVTLCNCTIVLFHYIAGATLADAYPIALETVSSIARLTARLHRIKPPTPSLDDIIALPTESFDISFIPTLEICLELLASRGHRDDPIVQSLQAALLPRREQLREMLDLMQQLRAEALQDSRAMVLCHGDMWGGNLILGETGELNLIDWESVLIAPIEFDLMGYIGEEFGTYLSAYEQELRHAIHINTDVLRFYCYRHHLRNLTNWLQNLLVRSMSPEQRANDLDMILHHCMDRWDSIEPLIHAVELFLQDRK
ncbi:phosphotransferase family enzyme [Paenibacillus taihuensis]|uniref:Phosphotransferase family enzyme n=1 Tax=Paenibacillus taihuensis TaxID=1156355 RepID=A0A3D9QWS0_9BACL|nr:phosphotransferase [Paenibacillus taihuensis]REE69674.1 phosphotransferase family enzyme [Paenibacillus taihuensis]